MHFITANRITLFIVLPALLLALSCCEKNAFGHKTSSYGRLDFLPALPDSVLDGADYQLTNTAGETVCLLECGSSSLSLNQYMFQNMTVYGRTYEGLLYNGVKHIQVDSAKVN